MGRCFAKAGTGKGKTDELLKAYFNTSSHVGGCCSVSEAVTSRPCVTFCGSARGKGPDFDPLLNSLNNNLLLKGLRRLLTPVPALNL